jgi:8-oxo-dGTP pyrophosphatase MutT (NUDIX family)
MLRKLKVSKITQEFLKLVKGLRFKDIYKTPTFKGGKKWLTVKMVFDPKEKGKEFFFVERLGKDSVAFILIDNNREGNKYQILKQYSSPYEKFQEGTFTGSLDKEDLSKEEIVIEEVKEEAGYDVDESRIQLITSEEVGSSTNEIVHMYLVDITGLKQEIREPENIFEENMDRKFVDEHYINNNCEWKSCMIVYKAKNMGII